MTDPTRATITAADNGLIVEWMDEDDEGNPLRRTDVFQWRDEDFGELPAWQEMFYRLLEIMGGPLGSKHDAKRLVVSIEDKGEEDAQ